MGNRQTKPEVWGLKEIGEYNYPIDFEMDIKIGDNLLDTPTNFTKSEEEGINKLTSDNVKKLRVLSNTENRQAIYFFRQTDIKFLVVRWMIPACVDLCSQNFISCAKIVTLSININHCETNLRWLIKNATGVDNLNIDFVDLEPQILVGLKFEDIPSSMKINLCSHNTFIGNEEYYLKLKGRHNVGPFYQNYVNNADMNKNMLALYVLDRAVIGRLSYEQHNLVVHPKYELKKNIFRKVASSYLRPYCESKMKIGYLNFDYEEAFKILKFSLD